MRGKVIFAQLRVGGVFDAILGGIGGDELGVFRGILLEIHRAAITAEVIDLAVIDGGEFGVRDIITRDGALGVVQVDRGGLGGGRGVCSEEAGNGDRSHCEEGGEGERKEDFAVHQKLHCKY